MEGTETVPMTNAVSERYESGLRFCGTGEGVKEALSRSAGKALLLSDGGLLLTPYSSPRAISLVFDGDALPLFSMPDGVSRVIASGGEDVLRAARYFAEVRGIPCTLLPADASLYGLFEHKAEILLNGKPLSVPLKAGEIVCDIGRMKPTFAEAYARFLLIRLAKIETKALEAIKGVKLGYAEAAEPKTPQELLFSSAEARKAEALGAYAGEGMILSRLLKGEPSPCWSALLLLSALYAAFFGKGKPRRYFTPDYRARAKEAGTPFSGASVPTAEEYVSRAMALERVRAHFAAETLAFLDGREEMYAALSAWTERKLPMRCARTEELKRLPEFAPAGLSAVIRDFGLMDWDYDKGRTFTVG